MQAIDLIKQHIYFSEAETRRRTTSLMWQRNISIVSFFVLIIIGGVISEIGPVVINGYTLKGPELFVLALLVLCWTYVANSRLVWYRPASDKLLERSQPMLEGDSAIRSIVREWTQVRPLQMRDAQALVDALPVWKQAKGQEKFTKSLGD